ncbi:MAG: hypothetical protein M1839_002780 [Geoglossum umbratile]|nr:MAG: hypothetical protein M1839_002780 [Geoglossum umbratile]
MATQALEAFSSGNYALAVTLYTTLLSQYPSTLDYYIKRSTAHQRTADYASALSDAEVAVMLAHKRSKKDILAAAQLRRGIALFMLQRYGDAMVCFDAVKKLNDKERGLDIWVGKCEKSLRELPTDDGKRLGSVKEIPDVEVPKAGSFISSGKGKENAKSNDDGKQEQNSTTVKAPAAAAVQIPATKIRHEWYQTTQDVVFTLLAKGVPKDKASIDIQEQYLSISFPLASGATYDFSLDPLYGPINPSTSTSNIYSTKIEITLKKSTPGQNWKALEGTAPIKGKEKAAATSADPPEATSITKSAVTSSPATAHPPSYPTSSKRGPKDWDKVAADLTRKRPSTSKSSKTPSDSATQAPGEDGEDSATYDDDDEGDPVNSFFKKLYAGADPDTRRAMTKSYQESNGTALSTNWSEVGAKTVEVSPPEGMVAKKWGE